MMLLGCRAIAVSHLFVGRCYLCVIMTYSQTDVLRQLGARCEWWCWFSFSFCCYSYCYILTIGHHEQIFSQCFVFSFRQFSTSSDGRRAHTDFYFAIQAYGARHVCGSSAMFVCRRCCRRRRRLFMCVLIATLYGERSTQMAVDKGPRRRCVSSEQMSFPILIKNSK